MKFDRTMNLIIRIVGTWFWITCLTAIFLMFEAHSELNREGACIRQRRETMQTAMLILSRNQNHASANQYILRKLNDPYRFNP